VAAHELSLAVNGRERQRVIAARDAGLTVVHTLRPGVSHAWVADRTQVPDATCQFGAVPHRAVV